MSSFQQLIVRVRSVRRKWRIQVLVRGLAIFLACTVALLVLGVWGADLFGFQPAAVWSMRILIGGAIAFVVLRFLYAPLRRRISDLQVAQYIEEHHPQLEDRLVSAVEFGDGARVSPGMLDLLIRDVLSQMTRMEFAGFINLRRVASYGLLGTGALLALLVLLAWGPSFFPYGFDRLYVNWAHASVGSPWLIQVVPGDLEVLQGNDQEIRAQLVGFDSASVRLHIQNESSSVWNPVTMEPELLGSGYVYLLIDLQESARYFVESTGIRSEVHALKVVDLPRLDRIDLTYQFPAYTGMPPETVEDDGHILALSGTRVQLRVHTTQPVAAARLVFDDKKVIPLVSGGIVEEDDFLLDETQFEGALQVLRTGSYHVELRGPTGEFYLGSSEFDVETVEDAPPKLKITKPLRDVRATSVEEILTEVRAEDDIGIGGVELRFSVNAEAEQRVQFSHGGESISRDSVSVVSVHTFFLEEYGLQPGDLVSYYARAWDKNNVTGPGDASSDIYFIEVRPFEKEYSQSQSASGGGSGDGAQQALSRQQKEIVSATFKIVRDKELMDAKEYRDALSALALVQGRLQAQAEGIVTRLHRRGALTMGEDFGRMTQYLQSAIAEMGLAAAMLGEEKAKEALPKEQKALQQVMRAESLFREIQVSFGRQGGGQGDSQANAEDLADLFELELNKLKNQYETVRRGEERTRDQEVDEALQRIKELAQRQQQINERSRQMATGSSVSSSGGNQGQGQRQQLREAEELHRQLQRLSREKRSPAIDRVSQQLRRAIQNMKRSLDRNQRGNHQEASAEGSRALQELQEAQRALQRSQDTGLSEGLDEAALESNRLLQEQERIEQSVGRLIEEGSDAEGFQRKKEALVERKSMMADRLENLRSQIEDLSQTARRNRSETRRQLAEASRLIREKRLADRIRQGGMLLDRGRLDTLRNREEFVRSGLQELRKQLESARDSVGQTTEGRLAEALEQTRSLADGLESMRQRLRQPGQQGGEQARGRREGNNATETGKGRNSSGQNETQRQQQAGPPGEGRGSSDQGNPAGGPGSRDVRGLSRNAYGPPVGMGPYGDDAGRQFRSEIQQRILDVQELRRLLDRETNEGRNLENVLQQLRRLNATSEGIDPRDLIRLEKSIDLLHGLEEDLSRELARMGHKDRYFYSEDNQAPAEYQKLVEEYYKALARGRR